jgi:hypothetical protein
MTTSSSTWAGARARPSSRRSLRRCGPGAPVVTDVDFSVANISPVDEAYVMAGMSPLAAGRGMSNDDLVPTCWSSAGDAASDRADLRSPLPSVDEYGFAGI